MIGSKNKISNLEEIFKDEHNLKIKIKALQEIDRWAYGKREIIITNKGNYLIYYNDNKMITDIFKMLKNGQRKLMKTL